MKTATQQFIKDAIAGGLFSGMKGVHVWANKVTHLGTTAFNEQSFSFAELLLRPEAWQAVGKTRGWNNHMGPCDCPDCRFSNKAFWNEKWKRFIDHLAHGKTIDEALQAIS